MYYSYGIKPILESLAGVIYDTLSEATIKPEFLISDGIRVNFMTLSCSHSFILSKIGDTSLVELLIILSVAFLNSLLITSNESCSQSQWFLIG